MDSITSTDNLCIEIKTSQEHVLLDIIKELCSENKLSPKLRGKVNRVIADCDLMHHTSLHKMSTPDESTSTLLGFIHQTNMELMFEEQAELNQSIIQKIQNKLPVYITELEHLKDSMVNGKKTRKQQIHSLQESLDEKLKILEEQENEKLELMMEWLNHRLREVTKFSNDSSEMLTLKTRVLELKSKILHLQILQNIFTETNQSLKAYSEVHKDLKDTIKETEQRIEHFKEIIDSDFY